MFQFHYMVSEDDYIELNQYHAFNSPANKKYMLISRFVFPIIFVVIGLIAGRKANELYNTYLFYAAFGIAAILWLIFYKQIMAELVKAGVKRTKKSGKLPYHSDVTIYFDNDFFVEASENGEARVNYSVIERIIIAKKAIYIYTGAVQAILMPLTVFSNEQNRDDFIAFIEKKCAAK